MVVGLLLFVFSACRDPSTESTAPIRVAAASDLSYAFPSVGDAHELRTGRKVTFSFGSSGLLAKQIEEGASFDVFAAADVSFVDRVVERGACRKDTKVVYARGRVVLWTAKTSDVEAPRDLADLADPRFVKIAIANPEHAPYGRAAKQALQSARVWDAVESKLVYGDNVMHALQFARTGNVEVAIVARSIAVDGITLSIDERLHAPLDQAMVACGRGLSGSTFISFVLSTEGQKILERSGLVVR